MRFSMKATLEELPNLALDRLAVTERLLNICLAPYPKGGFLAS
jgi:hypothetical protein